MSRGSLLKYKAVAVDFLRHSRTMHKMVIEDSRLRTSRELLNS